MSVNRLMKCFFLSMCGDRLLCRQVFKISVKSKFFKILYSLLLTLIYAVLEMKTKTNYK